MPFLALILYLFPSSVSFVDYQASLELLYSVSCYFVAEDQNYFMKLNEIVGTCRLTFCLGIHPRISWKIMTAATTITNISIARLL